MSQRDLDRQVARATGETVRVISSRGFVPLVDHVDDDELSPIDWDRLHAEQTVSVMPPPRHEALCCVD